MKKLLSIFFVFTLSSGLILAEPIEPLNRKTIKNMTTDERQSRVNLLEKRLTVIKEMDLKSLDRKEKREVKKEIKRINKELKRHAIGGGVYISVGALIIIILLLILLL